MQYNPPIQVSNEYDHIHEQFNGKKRPCKNNCRGIKKTRLQGSSNLDLEKEHSLANILYLATGNGTYKLSPEQINQIKNDEFSIDWK